MQRLAASEADGQVTSTELSCAIRKIIHVDMDAFYASVEQRDDPALRGRPVIVGGRPNGRGVVAACSYEARHYGVHSAMPSAEAGRRCPHAAFVKPRFDVYREVSRQIHAVFAEFSTRVEPLSLDEAYLDVTGVTLLGGSAVRMAREIKQRIFEATQLIASAGVSYNKFLAKVASDYDKPDGLFWVLPEDGAAFVAALPVGQFYGVGRATELRMHELGIHTGADLLPWSLEELTREFGRSAGWYYGIARGIDERPVRATRSRKSMGAETTFSHSLTCIPDMLNVLDKHASDLVEQLSQRELIAHTLTVKVRFDDFTTLTRSHSDSAGIRHVDQALRILPFLLQRALAGQAGPSVRLLGVSLSGLRPADSECPIQLELGF